MTTQRTSFTTPVGRLVMGSLYKPQTTDAEGKPLVVKTGTNAGQPRSDFFFAVAIPKAPGEQHWAQTEWGAKIWAAGHAGFPQGQANAPTFAWKVTDGDSQVPNKKGKKPCDREGYKGHWVVSFSSGYAPKIYNRDGSAVIVEPDAVKLGYYVQVNGEVAGNDSPMQPGVYINHNMVALSAYGPEIFVGPDVASAGFGAAPLPAGASATPPAGFAPAPAVGAPPATYTPPAAPVGIAPPASPSSPPPPPNYAFLGAPGAPTPAHTPVIAPPALAVPVRMMTAAANGATYEQLIGAGWTDALLIQHGMMVQS